MPDFNPPPSNFSLPSSHSLPPDLARRRYPEPGESGQKSSRYPSVYQRPPPAEFHRSSSPPHRWPPTGPPDEPIHPPPHPNYRRETWDYRFREPVSGPPPPGFTAARPPSPFHEWSRPPPPSQGWSPRRGSDGDWVPRRDWNGREGSPAYGPSGSWDRSASPPPREWMSDPYSRRPPPHLPPPMPDQRGSPPLIHEPGWGREPAPHFDQYERDIREDWIHPDGWAEGDEMSPHIYPGPSHTGPYGPSSRPRSRSFMQDRRAPLPSGSSYNPSPQPSSRGPGPAPIDSHNRRHSQHDRRYGGPGYSGEARAFVPNNAPRRQFQSGRGSFNDSNRAKLVPRDQLLVANTSIKTEDPDGPVFTNPVSASSSTSPEKALSTGKRARTDSVAADNEPASRRPSPFTNSTPAAVRASATQAGVEATPTSVSSTGRSSMQPDINTEPQGNMASTKAFSEQAYMQPVDTPSCYNHSDELAAKAGTDSSSNVTHDAALDKVVTDAKSSTVTSLGPPVDTVASSAVPESIVPDANGLAGDIVSETDSDLPRLPLLHFEYLEFSDDDDGRGSPVSLHEAISLRSLDFGKLSLNVEDILQTNLKLASHRQPIRSVRDDIPALNIFSMPDESVREEFRSVLRDEFSEREESVEVKLGDLEEEYLTLNAAWAVYCQGLDEVAEKRRLREAAAVAAAVQNVVSEPVATQTRSTRRNPLVNSGVMADAVHSDLEMEKVMSNMRDAAAVDPDLLARPNLARIPDMVTVTEPEMLRFTFDDENGQVDDPMAFYDFKGRAIEHWTLEERDTFIEQHRIFNKRFDKIAEHLPHKTTSQCVTYYYLMKKVPAFRAQVKRGQRRRLGRGGHQGKASALMADIEKEEDGTTASPREDESIATRRSRRHAATSVNNTAHSATPPPSSGPEVSKPRRPRVVELARADSFDADRGGTTTPVSFASDSETGGDVPHPSDLGLLLSTQPLRKGGPGRGRRWAYKGEVPNGSGGSVRLDGAEPPRRRPATTSYWTVAERTALKQNLLWHGRDWNRIASVIQTKTAIQAKNYYFNNQKELSVFVRAWEKERSKESNDNLEPTLTTSTEAISGANSAQPNSGQPSSTAGLNLAQPPKVGSGRGNAHYPNVVPQLLLPQQQNWAKSNVPSQHKPSPSASHQAPAIPAPPLPLPGPTFRAWPVSTAPSQPVSNSFVPFAGVSGMGAIKSNGPGVPAAGSSPAPGPAAPRLGGAAANVGGTSSPGASTGGVQRNLSHYPGPMRYQPYPITTPNVTNSIGGVNKGKVPPPRTGAPLKPAAPGLIAGISGTAASPPLRSQLGTVMSGSNVGQFASWNGEGKGKKPVQG